MLKEELLQLHKDDICPLCNKSGKENKKYCSKHKRIECKCDFSSSKNTKDKLYSSCKTYKREYAKLHRQKAEVKQYQKEWYEQNKTNIKEQRKDYYERYKKTTRAKERRKEYNKKNSKRKEVKAYKKRYSKRLYVKISMRLRNRLNMALRRMPNVKRHASAIKDLGCSVKEFRAYIESKFYPNKKTGEQMTWDNWALNGWHLDHIIPLASFDLTDPEQQKQASHHTNIQPLWAEENLSKGKKQ